MYNWHLLLKNRTTIHVLWLHLAIERGRQRQGQQVGDNGSNIGARIIEEGVKKEMCNCNRFS